MSLVLANSTTVPQPEGITRYTLFRRLATETGLLQTGEVTNADIDHVEDTIQLRSTQYSPGDWVGGWLRISQTADNSAPEAEIRPISDYEPATGRVAISPNLTSAPNAGDKYELWRVDPNIVIQLVDEALVKELTIPVWTMLSEVPDYDMEQTGLDYWTATNATLTKESESPRLSTNGKRHLRVVATSDNGYAESEVMNIEPHQTYWVSALARAEGTTATLQLYDQTNGAVIDSISTQRYHTVRPGKWVRVPRTCYQITIRLVTADSGQATEWDEVVLFPNYATEISAPWWVNHHQNVLGVFRYLPLGVAQDIYDPTLRGEEDSRFDVIPNRLGTPKYTIRSRVGTLETPLFIYGLRYETAYADDNSDAKYLASDYIMACVKYYVYRYLTQPLISGIVQNLDAAAKLEIAQREYFQLKHEHNPQVRNIITSPTPTASYIDDRFTFGARH